MENPLIETRDLTRRFGVQLAVYGFLGPNGAGKTTAIEAREVVS